MASRSMKYYNANPEKYGKFARDHYYRYHERNKKAATERSRVRWASDPESIKEAGIFKRKY